MALHASLFLSISISLHVFGALDHHEVILMFQEPTTWRAQGEAVGRSGAIGVLQAQRESMEPARFHLTLPAGHRDPKREQYGVVTLGH